jgi:hypothetical protein
MSQPSGTASRLPWIVAVCLAVLVAVLTVGFIHVHTASRNHARNPYGSGYGLTADQQAAVTAAATEAANVTTYNRKTFDADYERALKGATGSLKSDITSDKAQTLSTLTTGKVDFKGTVAASAYQQMTSDGKGVVVLVTVNTFQVFDTASQDSNAVQRLVVTMVKSGKVWLASTIDSSGFVQ